MRDERGIPGRASSGKGDPAVVEDLRRLDPGWQLRLAGAFPRRQPVGRRESCLRVGAKSFMDSHLTHKARFVSKKYASHAITHGATILFVVRSQRCDWLFSPVQ